jgi:hypothetical protein
LQATLAGVSLRHEQALALVPVKGKRRFLGMCDVRRRSDPSKDVSLAVNILCR